MLVLLKELLRNFLLTYMNTVILVNHFIYCTLMFKGRLNAGQQTSYVNVKFQVLTAAT
jgi:hypothetical protein